MDIWQLGFDCDATHKCHIGFFLVYFGIVLPRSVVREAMWQQLMGSLWR